MYPSLKLMRFVPPLEGLSKEGLDEPPLCATDAITLSLYRLF
jgi:hypothetical protein